MRKKWTGREMGQIGLIMVGLVIFCIRVQALRPLALLGLYFVAVAGIAGFRKMEKQPNSFWRTVNLLLTVTGLLGLVFFTFGSGCGSGHSREKARQISCASNLKQIGLALKQYAMDYRDCFPPENGAAGLDYLRRGDYLTDYRIYVCPSCTTPPASGSAPVVSDYEYRGGLTESGANAEKPIAWDKLRNHPKTVNVLFVDGHVEPMPPEQLEKRLRDNGPPR